MEGQPETNQHIAGGPSQVAKRERDRGGEWMELSHFGSGVRHLVQGWRMFSLGSCCLEWSTSDSAGKALLCSCKWQHEEHRDDRETLKVRSLLSIVMGLGAKQTHRIGWLLE